MQAVSTEHILMCRSSKNTSVINQINVYIFHSMAQFYCCYSIQGVSGHLVNVIGNPCVFSTMPSQYICSETGLTHYRKIQ